MFKFLRKYNKWILAVGGSLLMITFIVGNRSIQSLSRSLGGGGALIATVDGDELKAKEWEQIKGEVQLITRLRAMGIPAISSSLVSVIESPEHWYLLSREAEQAGLIGGDTLFISFKYAQRQGDIPQLGGFPDRFIRDTMRKIEGVNRLSALYIQAGKHSDRRLRNIARRKLHSVQSQFVVLKASEIPAAEPPSEERLVEQLAEYGDVTPGEGEMGFGYKMPNRVKLEWLGIEVEPVQKMIELSEEMDDSRLREHWLDHENDEELGFPPVDDAAEVPEVVVEHLLAQLTRETLDAIGKYATNELRRPRRPLPTSEFGYHILPEDWDQTRLSFPNLAGQIQEKYGIAAPTYRAAGDEWLVVDTDLTEEKVGPIAKAGATGYGQTTVSLKDMVAAAKEFGGSTSMMIQQGVASPVLSIYPPARPDQEEDESAKPVYIFRIIDTDPARPPVSVDEVRDALVADILRYDHYQQLLASVEDLEAEVREDGLLAFALDHDTFIQPKTEVSMCSRGLLDYCIRQGREILVYPSPIPGLGNHEETVNAILDRALSLPMDKPLDTLTADERMFVLPVESELSILVVELLEQQPLPEETYEQIAANGMIQRLVRYDDLDQGVVLREAFSAERLIARHEFTFKREDRFAPTDSETTDDESTDDAAAEEEETATAAAG